MTKYLQINIVFKQIIAHPRDPNKNVCFCRAQSNFLALRELTQSQKCRNSLEYARLASIEEEFRSLAGQPIGAELVRGSLSASGQ